MDQTIRRLLDELPSKPFRSKLEPHRELIRELRRRRRSYQEIAQFFGAKLHIHVAPPGVARRTSAHPSLSGEAFSTRIAPSFLYR